MRKVLLLAFLLFPFFYGQAQNQYTWILSTGDLDEPDNWSPRRDNPLPDDILIFDGGNASLVYITNFSPQEVIGQMVFLNNVSATFQTGSSGPGPGTVSWSGSTVTGVGTSFLSDFVPGDFINISGTVVEVASVTSSNRLTTTTTGSISAGASYTEYARLTLTGGTNAFYIDNSSSVTVNASSPISFYTAAGTTGDIEGSLNFSVNQHRLNAASAASWTFGATSQFTQSSGFIGNAFTAAGVPNAVTFTSGSTFNMNAGSTPFGLTTPSSKVVFQTGSFFKQTVGSPDFNGRKYANYELSVNGSLTATGSSAASVDNIVLSGTSTNFTWNLTGNPGHTIKGNITVGTGCSFNFFPIGNTTPGTVTFGGSSLQTISNTNQLNPITINSNATIINGNPAGIALAPTAMIKIVTGSNITFDLNNNPLTLKSTINGTAQIGTFDGIQSNYLLNATNVTVERYIPTHASRVYTLVTSPVNSPTIYNSWQEGGAATVGYGTQISGSSAGNGFDFASASGTASIFQYDDTKPTGQKWVGLTNTNNTNLGTGTGYLLFVRGDRTVGAGSAAPQATTLRAHGSLMVGSVLFATNGGTPGTLNLTRGANKYNLIANPFACAFTWSTASVFTDNLVLSYTVYDPNLGVFVTSDGTTISNSASKQQANIIQPGQAFFIQNDASGNDPDFLIQETDKTTSFNTKTANTVFGMEAPTVQLNVNCYKNDSVFADGIVAVFNSSYAKQEDKKDANKFTNFAETISFAENNNRFLSIDAHPMPLGSDTLFIDMKQMTANATYKMVIDGNGFTDNNLQSATLVDKQTGTSTPLDLTATNNYSFTTSAATQPGRLFIVLNAKPLAIVTPPVSDSSLIINSNLQVNLLGNPVKDKIGLHYTAKQAGNTTIRLMDANGQALNSLSLGVQQQGTVNIPVAQYASGMYFVEVTVGGNKAMVKVMKN